VTVRFLADEDLDADIIRGLHSREPAIDILDVKTAGLRGAADPEILELAAHEDRVLITHDRNTMTRYFRRSPRCGDAHPRHVYTSPAERRYWYDHRVAASRVDGIAIGRMAESDGLFALSVNGRV
jgi:hypothetical protein